MTSFRSFHLQSTLQDFSRIRVRNLPIDQNHFGLVEISVTSVNFQNVIRTLTLNDYIRINNITYKSLRECKNQSPSTWCGVLGDIIYNSNVRVSYDELGRLYFISDVEFTIQAMSYNIRILCGVEETEFPLESFYAATLLRYVYRIPRYGSYSFTPTFYLV